MPQYLVEAKARDFGHRGVTVNSILPTAIKGVASTAGASDLVREFVRSSRPIARMGTLDDVANAADYLASDLAGLVSSQHLLLSGAHQPDGEIGESRLSVGMLDACSSLHRPVASRAAFLIGEQSDRSITGWARGNALESSRHPWNASIRALSVSIISTPCALDLGHVLSHPRPDAAQ